jgi:hypothetical protein
VIHVTDLDDARDRICPTTSLFLRTPDLPQSLDASATSQDPLFHRAIVLSMNASIAPSSA